VINGYELIVLLIIAAVVLGPERLPGYAAQLAQLVRRGRELLRDTQERVNTELGDDLDWESLDPRRYDPRRIVREALSEELPPRQRKTPDARKPPSSPDQGPVAFDDEAT